MALEEKVLPTGMAGAGGSGKASKRARSATKLCGECNGFHDPEDNQTCLVRQGVTLAHQLVALGGGSEERANKRQFTPAAAVGSVLVPATQLAASGVVSRLLYSLHGLTAAKSQVPSMSMEGADPSHWGLAGASEGGGSASLGCEVFELDDSAWEVPDAGCPDGPASDPAMLFIDTVAASTCKRLDEGEEELPLLIPMAQVCVAVVCVVVVHLSRVCIYFALLQVELVSRPECCVRAESALCPVMLCSNRALQQGHLQSPSKQPQHRHRMGRLQVAVPAPLLGLLLQPPALTPPCALAPSSVQCPCLTGCAPSSCTMSRH